MKSAPRTLGWTSFIYFMAITNPAFAAQDLNLFHAQDNSNVPPNIFMMLDDSGSIDFEVATINQWAVNSYLTTDQAKMLEGDGIYFSEHIPECERGRAITYLWENNNHVYDNVRCDKIAAFGDPIYLEEDWRLISQDFNRTYYNPEVNYEPWVGYPAAQFTAARAHPDASQNGYTQTRNLGTEGFEFVVAEDTAGFTGAQPSSQNPTKVPNGLVDIWDNYALYAVTTNQITVTRHTFNPIAAENCLDRECLNQATQVGNWNNPFGRTLQEEQQNIANWYQYHRRRSFALKYVIGKLVNAFPDYRYGMSFINNYNDVFIEVPEKTANTGTHNDQVLKTMYEYTQQNAGTPLQNALDLAGQYFSGKTDYTAPVQDTCQSNYTLLLTDGYWNQKYTGQAQGDIDKDGYQTTLADIASFYYTNDIAPQIPNTAQTQASICPSVPLVNHQNVSTIGVAFGPSGKLAMDDQQCWTDPPLDANDSWGDPIANESGERIDDLWHAAYNSNGFFVSSANPAQLIQRLQPFFASIGANFSSGAGGSLEIGRVDQKNQYYLTDFDINKFAGDLKAFEIDDTTGQVSQTSSWSAAQELQSNTNRLIYSSQVLVSNQAMGITLSPNRAGAQAFTKAQLDTLFPINSNNAQLTAASQWLNRLFAQNLGPTVHSNPQFVGAPSRVLLNPDANNTGTVKSYDSFKQRQANRDPMVYIGTNAGLLHGFSAADGEEIFAFLPNAALNEKLPLFNSGTTSYTSSVDGKLLVEDAYLSASDRWASVLVSGLRNGGQAYFALDVTNPEGFTKKNPALWEFSDAMDADLGYTYAKAAIGQMANGRWAAVLSNGYNNTDPDGNASTSGQAAIFVIDVETGELLAKLDTDIGSEQDPLGQNRPNGMAEPALVDSDFDGLIDVIYAGDFFGNLHRFDVSSANSGQWNTAETLVSIPQATGNIKPIITKPSVMLHPSGEGLMVFAGTGENILKYSSLTSQVLFGVWDQGNKVAFASLDKNTLEQNGQQWLITTPEQDADDLADQTPSNGWQLTLNNAANGYALVNNPILQLGELNWALQKTNTEACAENAGTSLLLSMQPNNGGSLNRQVYRTRDTTQATDGIEITGGILLNAAIAGFASEERVIGHTDRGDILSIEKTMPPNSSGQIRWRRLSQ